MPENKHHRFLLRVTYICFGALGLWLALHFLLPWLLPFLTALGLSTLLEPGVRFLEEKTKLKRWIASALCTALLAVLLCAGLLAAAWRIGYEVTLLLQRLPGMLTGISSLGGMLDGFIYRLLVAAPVPLQEPLRALISGLVGQGVTIPGQFYAWLLGAVSAAAAAVPDWMLFVFTAGLATYFSSAHRGELMSFLRRQVPRAWRPKVHLAMGRMKTTFGGWLKAQGLMMLVTFGELCVGLLMLRVDYAVLLAALTALVDALPVFGTGAVLLPWAVFEFLSGRWRLALGLVILYWVVSAVRGLLEPKLVGDRVGLPPLAALAAMYIGFRAFGVAGMILSPLAAMFLKELHDCGFIRLWRD